MSNNRKDNLIRVRVTAKQQEDISKAAASQNKTTSQFVRDRTLSTPKKGILSTLFGSK